MNNYLNCFLDDKKDNPLSGKHFQLVKEEDVHLLYSAYVVVGDMKKSEALEIGLLLESLEQKKSLTSLDSQALNSCSE